MRERKKKHSWRRRKERGTILKSVSEKSKLQEILLTLWNIKTNGREKDYRVRLQKFGVTAPDFIWYESGIMNFCNMGAYGLQTTEVYDGRVRWMVHGYSVKIKTGMATTPEAAKQRAEEAYLRAVLMDPFVLQVVKFIEGEVMANDKVDGTVQVPEVRGGVHDGHGAE